MSENKETDDNNAANRSPQPRSSSRRRRQQEPYRVHMGNLLAQMRDAERRRPLMTPGIQFSSEILRRNLNHYNYRDNPNPLAFPVEFYPSSRSSRISIMRPPPPETITSNNEATIEENATNTVGTQQSEENATSSVGSLPYMEQVVPSQPPENNTSRRKRTHPMSPGNGSYSPKRIPRFIHPNRAGAGNSPRASTSTATGPMANANLFEGIPEDSAAEMNELLNNDREQFQNIVDQEDNVIRDILEGDNEHMLADGNSGDLELRAMEAIQNFQEHYRDMGSSTDGAAEAAPPPPELFSTTMRSVFPIFLLHPNLVNPPSQIERVNMAEYKARLAKLNAFSPATEAKEEDSSDQCVICQSEFEPNQNIRSLKCDHKFHVACIDKWCKSAATCPVCRRGFDGSIIKEKTPPRSPPTTTLRSMDYILTYLIRRRAGALEESDTNSITSNDGSP